MAFHAYFIGTNNFANPDIRELSGASRDAIALYSIFKDSLPSEDIHSLIDQDATRENVLKAFKHLTNATSDDTIIIFFSGHGTKDHRLVMHDTSLEKLQETTISMEDLAEGFRSCKASRLIIILDCCFSGGTNAKVLEKTPVSKDPENPIKQIIGEGRVILTASSKSEPAYEHPSVSHGVFSKILIELLINQDEQWSVGKLGDDVIRAVKAEAEALGLDQTPECFNYVKGEFLFPKLLKGNTYHKEFPEEQGIRVSEEIEQLEAFNINPKVISNWKDLGISKLNEFQLNVINEKRILDGKSLLAIAPTSTGKTLLGESAAAAALAKGQKVIFLFPYRALTAEKYEYFSKLFANSGHDRVIQCRGDFGDHVSTFLNGKYDVAALTYETFLYLLVRNENILQNIGLVVLDEGQFISNDNRGINVELLLTYLLTFKRIKQPQLLVLSAVVGAINSFHDWLGIDKFVYNKRPIPLREGVLDRGGVYQYKDELDGTEKQIQLVPSSSIVQRKKDPSSQDIIVPLVKQLVPQKEKILIFRNSKGTARGGAKYLADELGIESQIDMSSLSNYDLSAASTDLRYCLPRGTAIHTADLTPQEREFVEKSYKDNKVNLPVLSSTTTLAAGVNTPASIVIIPEAFFYTDEGKKDYTIAEYKNMAGRAGRLGYGSEIGISIMLADTTQERLDKFRKYVMGTLEPFASSFKENGIRTWLIKLLAQMREKVDPNELIQVLLNSYGGYIATKNNSHWREEKEAQLTAIIQEMRTYNLIEEERGKIGLSLLGKACGRSTLSYESTLRLIELLNEKRYTSYTPEIMVFLMQLLDELNDGSTPKAPGKTDSAFTQTIISKLRKHGINEVRDLQRYAASVDKYNLRCKRLSVIFDWLEGSKIVDIENSHSLNLYWGRINRGDIIGFSDLARFHLRSAYEIASLVIPELCPQEDIVESFAHRLEFGLPRETLFLLPLITTIEREQLINLIKAGYTDGSSILAASENDLSPHLSQTQIVVLKQHFKGKEENT